MMISFCFLGIFLAISLGGTQKRNLVWSDEFEVDGLPNSDRWGYNIGNGCPNICGWGNNELQYYNANKLENARVENGVLVIEAHKKDTAGNKYTSARLVTKGKASWQYGYIEVRAKLPKGRGTWPAIWMLPDVVSYGGWPKSGEIDIMEHVGYDPGVIHATVHTELFNHSIGTQKGKQVKMPDFGDAFHTYGVNWTPEKIEFFIDDQIYNTFENTGSGKAEWPFDKPFHILLNIAVGGNWGGKEGVDENIWPQKMEVDYVRVYQNIE